MTREQARTLADYRPQHDDTCLSRRCGYAYDYPHRLCTMRDDDHGVGLAHQWVAQPCSCGLSALLQALPSEPPDQQNDTGIPRIPNVFENAGVMTGKPVKLNPDTRTVVPADADPPALDVEQAKQRVWNRVAEWCEAKEDDAGLKWIDADNEMDALIAAVRAPLHREVERLKANNAELTKAVQGNALAAVKARDTAKTLDHYWTPDPTKRYCVICGDNGLGSVWGIHRFQIQPAIPKGRR